MSILTELSNTERSEYFRHRKDYEIFGRVLASTSDLPAKILMVGIANMEEPLSVLTVANRVSFQREVNLSEIVSIDFVDIRSRGEIKPEYSLGEQLKGGMSLLFASQEQISSMELEPRRPHYVKRYPEAFVIEDGQYKFSNPIIEFLDQQMLSESARFNTSLQEFIEMENDERYDFVFCNNVLTYVEKQDRASSASGLVDLLKQNGILFLHYSKHITDSKGVSGPEQLMRENPDLAERLEMISPAIYRVR